MALVLLLPAAWRADAQDMLVIDSGGARWKSGESRKPSVTVDFGVIDTLSADRRRGAFHRPDRRSRRYLTLSIPQPETPAAVAERLKATAAPPADPEPQPTAERSEPPVAPATEPGVKLAAKHPEPAAAPAAEPAPEKPARAGIPTPPARPATALSKPPDKPPAPPARAAPARRLPAGETEATPALLAFLSRADGTRPQAAAPSPAKPVRAKLPPPRPIQPRPAESGAAAPPAAKPDMPGRFRLPPPAPATDAPGSAAASPAPAGRLPPPPPATGAPGAGVLPPPAAPTAGTPETLRRKLALDAPGLAAIAEPVRTGTHSETFFYEAGGTALGAEDRARLGSLAARMAGGSRLTVEIRAYSGSVEGDGVEARRGALSRAMEIRRLLIAAGVPEARIVARAAGAGEEARAHVDVVLVGRS